ncbi:MAG: hypothetical protein D6736_06605 [Nitrospinota bacterium]|nr:MAG: hypothetical protein D6736_06605 [Nitrospinota bacterium]
MLCPYCGVETFREESHGSLVSCIAALQAELAWVREQWELERKLATGAALWESKQERTPAVESLEVALHWAQELEELLGTADPREAVTRVRALQDRVQELEEELRQVKS